MRGALQEDMEAFQVMFERAAVGVAQVETGSGRFLRVNRRFAELAGYEREELRRIELAAVVWPQDRATVAHSLRRLVDGDASRVSMAIRLRRKDGSVVGVGLKMSPLWAAGEPKASHLAVVEDLTVAQQQAQSLAASAAMALDQARLLEDRETARAALQQQAVELSALAELARTVSSTLALEEVTRSVLDGMSAAVRPDLAMLFLREGDRLIPRGVRPEGDRAPMDLPEHRVGECLCGLAARHARPVYARDIHRDCRCTWDECKKARLTSLAAIPLTCGDDVIGVLALASAEERDFEQRAGFLETLAGQASAAVANARLYEAVQRELAERRRSDAERGRLLLQLAHAQKMESVARLAGGVAHDFNNMLQAILGNAALAAQAVPAGSPAHECLEVIRRSAERSADLTRQLLAFARKQPIAPKVLDLNEAVGRTLEMLRRLMGEDIELAWAPSADLWPVKLDPNQLDQLLANLCLNARDAIAKAGTVRIETGNTTLDSAVKAAFPDCSPGDYVRLAVADSGRGMDPETLSHLFEPFFTTKEVGRGTGLGLATVFGIAKQNGGLVNVSSAPGRGATFELFFPRSREEVARSSPPRAEARQGRELVLVVEDEVVVLELCKRMLEQLGYAVLAASTPRAALELLATHDGPIDLLVTDVMMPGMNGKELRDRLRDRHRGLKCVFMSGYPADIIGGDDALGPGVEFLQKPFTLDALASKVRDALDRA